MAILELYSNRNAAPPDVWVYDKIPDKLRIQVSNLVQQTIGRPNQYDQRPAVLYEYISNTVAHEHGRGR